MKPVPRWFVALCWVLAIGFSMCIGLQINDPDPVRWMAFYGAAAVAMAIVPARRIFALAPALVGFGAAAWGAYLGSQVIDQLELSDLWLKMSEKGGAVEVGREAAGLMIVAVTAVFVAVFRATRR